MRGAFLLSVLFTIGYVALGADLVAPRLRLPESVAPTRYAADLTVDPGQERFQGTIVIELQVREAVSVIWLHGAGLRIRGATLAASGRNAPLTTTTAPSGFLGLKLPHLLGPGSATVTIRYEGDISSKEANGIFRQKEGGNWYLYTQFEPIDARRAFPCFDEPGFKTPWRLTLHTKRGLGAFSNSLAESEILEPHGMKEVRFAETKPLPSYLVAFAVGPFEVVDAGRAGRRQTPLRILTPKGRAAEARFAVETTGQLLARLENYFGSAFPFDKLDSVFIPKFPGAMENAGLITYDESILLARPDEETLAHRRDFAVTAAHEIAHHWVGDLVTMHWWDDTWLNEGFASWLENKIVGEWKPEWRQEVERVVNDDTAMDADAAPTARQVRQPINSNHDIANAFDVITYLKGGAILEMFENYLGPAVFQKGVREYVRANAGGTATEADFLRAISAAAGRDVSPALHTFLDQPGVPLVSAAVNCTRPGRPTVTLRQERYRPLGEEAPKEQWQIPVCLKSGDGAQQGQCVLLDRPVQVVALPASSCPEYVLANAGSEGYYRTSYSGDWGDRLFRTGAITTAEAVGATLDISAAVEAGTLPASQAFSDIRAAVRASDRHIVLAAAQLAREMQKFTPPEQRTAYAAFIRENFSARARALGWTPTQNEPEDARVLRPVLVALAAEEGSDEELVRQAKAVADRWLRERRSPRGELVGLALRVAAEHGDRALLDQYIAALRKADNRRDRDRLLNGLSAFRDPTLLHDALSLTLQAKFVPSDAASLLLRAPSDPADTGVVFGFVTEHYDAITARLPHDEIASLPSVASGFCSETREHEVDSFFRQRVRELPGGAQVLNETIKTIHLCTAQRQAQERSAAEFLEHAGVGGSE